MSTVLSDAPPTEWTLADVQARLPSFPSNRIRSYPSPGTATEEDVLEAEARSDRICELIDGTLVEKTMASFESAVAFELGYFIRHYLDANNLGMLTGEAGFLKILPGQIRARMFLLSAGSVFPERNAPKRPSIAVAPDLAVEILSEGNTPQEMVRKLREYFQAGVRLVWYIEPQSRTARAYTAEHDWTEITANGLLVGSDVLPGFELPLAHCSTESKDRGKSYRTAFFGRSP